MPVFPMLEPSLRLATPDDLPVINDIYNHYVASSTTTYYDQPMSLESRQAWFERREPHHPVTVVSHGDEVVAWGALGHFRPQTGYGLTVENSIYVRPGHLRLGLGSKLLADQIERSRKLQLWNIVAVIDSEQAGSLAIHRKFGFVEGGRLPRIARKFDRWLDIILMQLAIVVKA